jgi:response regulator of citrate/malate metabolism
MSIKLTFTPPHKKKLSSVFIVEDDTIQLNMVQDYFEKYPGLRVAGFSSGEACIKEIVSKGSSPDIILLDYFLDSVNPSSRDGLEILAKLSEICPDAMILMHTSVEHERIMDLARKKGARDYIVKGSKGFEKLDNIIESYFEVK